MDEIDLQPFLAIRRALWLVRLFAICVLITALVSISGDGKANSLAYLQVLLIYVSLVAILATSLHVLTLRIRKPIAIAELAASLVVCTLCVVIGLGSVARSVRNGNSIFGIVLAIVLTVLVLYRIHRFMYPAQRDPEEQPLAKPTGRPLSILYSVAPPERPGPRRSMERGWLAVLELFGWSMLIVVAAILVDSQNQPSDYVWMAAAILAALLLALTVVPAFMVLRGSRALLPAKLIAQHRSRRRSGFYTAYLIRKGKDRWRAIGYALAAIAAAIGLWFFNQLPFDEWFAHNSGVNMYLSGFYALFFFGIYAGLRKSVAVLAQSIPAGEVATIADLGGFTLYLRSFLDDAFQFDLGGSGWRRFLFLPPAGNVYQQFARSVRLEELVVKTLWCFRPIICVASPDGAPEPIGALQLPLEPECWQGKVNGLAERGVSVLMVLGGTPGVQWELRELVAEANLRGKLTLLVPPEDQALVTSRWQACFGDEDRLPASLLMRILAVKILPNGSKISITADDRSRAAYKISMHLAESLGPANSPT